VSDKYQTCVECKLSKPLSMFNRKGITFDTICRQCVEELKGPSLQDWYDQRTKQDAFREKDEALEQVHEEPWATQAMTRFIRLVPRGSFLGIAEEYRIMLIADGLPPPHHHNCWGSFATALVKAGLIEWTGEYDHMKGSKSHGRGGSKIYRR